jgi:4-amino-4-deoxy-L-arabinose transferase-like glycosyltransferase
LGEKWRSRASDLLFVHEKIRIAVSLQPSPVPGLQCAAMRRAGADLALVVVLSLVSNFAYLVYSNGDFFYPDSATYLAPAQNLIHGLGFVTSPGEPETFRTPGYPLFLVPFQAVTADAVPILAAQHLLNAFMAVAIYLFCRRRFARGVALMAALIFAIDGPSIHYANKVLSETLFTALLLLLVLSVDRIGSRPARWWHYAGAGTLTGALVLTRPVAVLYFLLLGAWLLWVKGSDPGSRSAAVRGVALFLLIAAAFPLGWAVRNRMRTGVFTVASVAGTNMLLYRAAGALAVLDDYDFKEALEDRQKELQASADAEIEERLHIADAGELDEAVRGRDYGAIGRRIALEHPFGLALVTLRGLMVNLLDSDWDSVMIVSWVPASLIQLTLDAWAAILVLLTALGLAGLWRRDRLLAALLGLTIGYFLLISAGGESEGRFRVPVMPLMAIAGALGARSLTQVVAAPSPD